jgi:hypothetical protein
MFSSVENDWEGLAILRQKLLPGCVQIDVKMVDAVKSNWGYLNAQVADGFSLSIL